MNLQLQLHIIDWHIEPRLWYALGEYEHRPNLRTHTNCTHCMLHKVYPPHLQILRSQELLKLCKPLCRKTGRAMKTYTPPNDTAWTTLLTSY